MWTFSNGIYSTLWSFNFVFRKVRVLILKKKGKVRVHLWARAVYWALVGQWRRKYNTPGEEKIEFLKSISDDGFLLNRASRSSPIPRVIFRRVSEEPSSRRLLHGELLQRHFSSDAAGPEGSSPKIDKVSPFHPSSFDFIFNLFVNLETADKYSLFRWKRFSVPKIKALCSSIRFFVVQLSFPFYLLAIWPCSLFFLRITPFPCLGN